MNDFRQKPQRDHARQAIDGFLNAPVNQGRAMRPNPGVAPRRPEQSHRPIAGSPAGQRRVIGDFKAPEGYRSASQTIRPTSNGPALRRSDSGEIGASRQAMQRDFSEPSAQKRRFGFGRKKHDKRLGKQKPTWRRWALRGTLAAFIITFALAGFLVTKGYLKLNNIFKGGGAAAALDTNVDPDKLRGEGDGRVNVLLLGRGGEGHDGPDLTDTIMVVSIDPVNKKAALLSIPRDLWVDSKYGDSKINAVFANAKSSALRKKSSDTEAAEQAGINAIESKIEEITGLNMHYYSIVDFQGFQEAVDTVGGVTMNVPEELRDPTMAWENNRNPVLAKAGVQQMNGKQALMYVRSRHGSARGDFDRAERQRLFLVALKSKILSSGTYGNPVKISKLMDNFGNHARTDFSLNDILRLYAITKTINNNAVESIGLADPPNDYVTTGNEGAQSVVVPKAGTFDYSDIKQYLRTQLIDGYIAKENAPVVILNGTSTAGLATKESNELKSYSYNVTKADTAPTQDYSKTILVDLTGKYKYTKNYLEKRLDVTATRTLPQGITLPPQDPKGFVIIIGRDEAVTQ